MFERIVTHSHLIVILLLWIAPSSIGWDGALFAGESIGSERELLDQPWHTHFVDETKKTPAGRLNAGAAWCDSFLGKALKGKLRKSAAQTSWDQWGMFLDCAIWGYLSPDSAFHGEERLVEMSRQWLDTLFVRLQTKPEDPKSAAKWQPNRLGTWSFHHYTTPLLETEARPALKSRLGAERVDRFRDIVLENIERNTTPEKFDDLMGRAETYINIIMHPMAVYIHGWVLTGEQKYLQMANRIIRILGRDQLPSGMFPYRYRIYGERHSEYEAMYYHAINIRGLYLYWWATGSKEAEAIFRKSVPYYPLNLEPPHYFNDGPDIWWKDQWRTFWPHHVAMVAAVTGDGENTTIANAMARDNVCHDRFDVVLGAHAFQQMALRDIAEQPVRNDYIIEDPDIRGVRLRFGRWSSTFTTGSFTYTRTSAMKVNEDDSSFSALHMARPYVRVAPLEIAHRTEPDYGTLGREGADYSLAIGERTAAVATSYQPALTSHTWRDDQPIGPWQMNELWLMTDRGTVGLVNSQCLESTEARELCHMFRFIPPARDIWAEQVNDSTYACGELRFRVWQSDMPFVIEEHARRYALSTAPKGRRDWQLCLSDTDRSPEQIAQDPPGEGQVMPARKLPDMRSYAKDYRRTSLVEVSPLTWQGFENVTSATQNDVLAFRVRNMRGEYLAVYNCGEQAAEYECRGKPKRIWLSWGQADDTTPILRVPSRGVALLEM